MAPKCACRLDCIEVALSRAFYHLGKFIARHPWPFLIIPVLVCGGLTGGLARITAENNSEILYTPTNGEAKNERRLVQEYFPENHTYWFLSSRKANRNGYIEILFTSTKDFGNIFTAEAFTEIIQFVNDLFLINVTYNGKVYSYNDICGKWKGQCEDNSILEIISWNPDNITSIGLAYPIHMTQFIGTELGGVITDVNGFVLKAEAVHFAYYIAYQTDDEKAIADAWIKAFTDKMLTGEYIKKFNFVIPNFETSLSMDDEIARSTGNIASLFSVAYTILMTFAAVSTSMKDWVRYKTWVALAGEISAVLAVGASIGILPLCGVLYTSTVGTMPFLIVGIGIDNMFVLLSSWRHTNYLLPVEERMAQSFEKAAVSITLTSVTDALAFAIGAYTNFLSIELFCAYTGVAVVFCYINTITFFGAVMVFSGRREAANRHVFTCMKAIPKEKAEGRSKMRRIFCVGGDSDMDNPDVVEKLLERGEIRTDIPFLSNFLGDTYAEFLMKVPVRIIVIILYLAYLGFSAWGCATLKEGLELQNLAPDDSYLISFYGNYSHYFLSEYGPRTMVVIHDPLDYSDAKVRGDVFNIINSFEESRFFFSQPEMTESWLRDFEGYLNDTNRTPANMAEFINILQTDFLEIAAYERYKVDLNFSVDNTEILGSRFMIQALGVENAVQEKELLLEVRDIASKAMYTTTAYHAAFIFYDQYIVIVTNTIRNLLMAALCMLLVAVFLLPHPLAVVWVTASVLSICFGVVGFMVFWNVNLDSISMINLIMCIGFSVDFSGHICYHFTVCNGDTPLEKVKESMRYLGLPIWQGAISTILGVVVLSFSNSYIFRTFFKLIFLVVLFGFLHAVVILPVILPTIGPGSCKKKRPTSVSDLHKEAMVDVRKEDEELDTTKKENFVIRFSQSEQTNDEKGKDNPVFSPVES